MTLEKLKKLKFLLFIVGSIFTMMFIVVFLTGAGEILTSSFRQEGSHIFLGVLFVLAIISYGMERIIGIIETDVKNELKDLNFRVIELEKAVKELKSR